MTKREKDGGIYTEQIVISLSNVTETAVACSSNCKSIFLCFVRLFYCFTSQVNSYGHGGTVRSPYHTFFLGKLEQAVNQYFVHIPKTFSMKKVIYIFKHFNRMLLSGLRNRSDTS